MCRLEHLSLSDYQLQNMVNGRELISHGNVMNQLTELHLSVNDEDARLGKSRYLNTPSRHL